MKKQIYRHQFIVIAAFGIALLSNPSIAAAQGAAAERGAAGTVLEEFTVDVGSTGPGVRAGGSGEPRSCQIAIGNNGKLFMVCEGVNASGNAVRCTSDEPPFTGALLGMTDFADVVADRGHPVGKCTKI